MTKTLKNERAGKERLKSILLYAYTLILFAMNFIRIFDNSFWEDEGFTIRLAKMNIPDMISATAADVHPPLYYLFTQALYHIFGNHGFTYHLSAIIPYVIILLLACTVIKKNFGRIPAVVLVTMSSLMKSAIQYNVEARMYSLGAAFVLIASLAFYKIQTMDKVRDWIAFLHSISGCCLYTLLCTDFSRISVFDADHSSDTKKKRIETLDFDLYYYNCSISSMVTCIGKIIPENGR